MRRRSLLLLLLCLALLIPQAAPAAKSAPSGVRVHLTRLNLADQVWMTLEGRYRARGENGTEVLLPPGARVTVFLRKGALVCFHGGLSFSAGKSLAFSRLRDGDTEPGIRFNLLSGVYPGDLELTVRDGAIRPVLTLPLESYLLGVVPYEMSDSFPLEALKAQAVCARTYALSKMGNDKAEWDLVDNTNDQVYRGTPEECENTARAVRETEGLVLTYNNKLITAWYSASNGGQTELPGNIWPGDGIPGCFAMTDDPWDLQNPQSTVRTAELGKDGSGFSAGMLRLLRAALSKEPELKNYRLGETDLLRVDAVKSIRLTDPRYKSPSRLMTRMEITADFAAVPKAAKADAAPEPAGTFTVTLDLFPEAVFMLGLSVYGADNEIITVTEKENSFLLSAGRFGHGVGMSQRGAQYQAAEGSKTFKEILFFYYPGAEIKRYGGEGATLPTPDPVLEETPGPVPTATPRPTLMPVTGDLPEGAWMASVENIDEDSTLNLREKPSAGAKVLMRLYKHQRLVVLEEAEVTGWVKVKTDAIEGYVMHSFLQKAE